MARLVAIPGGDTVCDFFAVISERLRDCQARQAYSAQLFEGSSTGPVEDQMSAAQVIRTPDEDKGACCVAIR